MDLSKLITAEDKLAALAAAELVSMKATLNKFRDDREDYLNRISGIGFAAQAGNRPDIVQHVLTVRRGLLDLTSAPEVVSATTLEHLKNAMLRQYATILAGVPAEVKSAFKGIGQ